MAVPWGNADGSFGFTTSSSRSPSRKSKEFSQIRRERKSKHGFPHICIHHVM
ncbi:hypothetical protein KI387_013111, partial [Taxus chinensis]